MSGIISVIRGLVANCLFATVLFISAGTFHYIQGWIYLGLNIMLSMVNFSYIRNDRSLLNERTNPGKNIKKWDKRILAFSSLSYMATLITAGYESRHFEPTNYCPITECLIGIVLVISGEIVFFTARKQNPYFSTVARIQFERNHTVCSSGLYSIVRHPGYLGMIISLCGIPIVLNSEWSMLPTLISVFLLILRTKLEDTMLKSELEGYAAYATKTRYKLLPQIW